MKAFSADLATRLLLCPSLILLINGGPTTITVADAQLDTSLVCVRPATPRGLGVHASGTLYVLDPGEGMIHEYNTADGQYLGNLTDNSGVAGGGIEVVGGRVFVAPASETDGTVEELAVANGSVAMTFPGEGNPAPAGGYDVAVDSNGTVYVSDFVDFGVRVYNGTTGDYVERILSDTKVLGVAFGPDDILYASIPEDDTVRRYSR